MDTTITDQLRTVTWSNYSHQTGVGNLAYEPNHLIPYMTHMYVYIFSVEKVFLLAKEYFLDLLKLLNKK